MSFSRCLVYFVISENRHRSSRSAGLQAAKCALFPVFHRRPPSVTHTLSPRATAQYTCCLALSNTLQPTFNSTSCSCVVVENYFIFNMSWTYNFRFRPHRIHEMRTIVLDDPGVCQSVTRAGWMDRRPVWGGDSQGPKKHCMMRVPISPRRGGIRCGRRQITFAPCSV